MKDKMSELYFSRSEVALMGEKSISKDWDIDLYPEERFWANHIHGDVHTCSLHGWNTQMSQGLYVMPNSLVIS